MSFGPPPGAPRCPYFDQYYRLPGFDPNAVCAFGCDDEPSCITEEWYDPETGVELNTSDWEDDEEV